MTPTKRQMVYYRSAAGMVFSAIVLIVHRDESATVEARFKVRDGKEVTPGYMGMKFRLEFDRLFVDPFDAARSPRLAVAHAAMESRAYDFRAEKNRRVA